MRSILTQRRFSNARFCHRLLTRPPAAPQRLQRPELRAQAERPAGGKRCVPSASRAGRAPCPHPRGAAVPRPGPARRPHRAPPPSLTRRRRPPLRRCPVTSQGSWLGAEAPCRTVWRRCGGGGSVSQECRGCAVWYEPSQVRGACWARAWKRLFSPPDAESAWRGFPEPFPAPALRGEARGRLT